MEPIRPDNEELRAERPGSSKGSATASPGRRSSGQPETVKSPAQPARSERKGGGVGSGVLWLLVIILACAGGAGWYMQSQRIQALESQIEDADSWVRQSKLALARIEGALSETGESLQQAGVSLDEQLASQKVQLDSAGSEIQKLWVVANERNKQQLEQQTKTIGDLKTALGSNREALVDVQTAVKSSQAALGEAVKQQQAEGSELVTLKTQLSAMSQRLDAATKDIDDRVAAPIRRFEQEQKLTTNGIEGRIAALEKEISRLASGNRLTALQRELTGLKRTVEVIDSSRSQTTSRLVRLSQEVNDVKSRLAGQ